MVEFTRWKTPPATDFWTFDEDFVTALSSAQLASRNMIDSRNVTGNDIFDIGSEARQKLRVKTLPGQKLSHPAGYMVHWAGSPEYGIWFHGQFKQTGNRPSSHSHPYGGPPGSFEWLGEHSLATPKRCIERSNFVRSFVLLILTFRYWPQLERGADLGKRLLTGCVESITHHLFLVVRIVDKWKTRNSTVICGFRSPSSPSR